MPWKEKSKMDARREFIERRLKGERLIELCREFEICRKTGQRLMKRHKLEGDKGALCDKTSRPKRLANCRNDTVRERVIAVRRKHPSWGSLKIRQYLDRNESAVRWPARSTIDIWLRKEGLIIPKKRRKTSHFADTNRLTTPTRPGQVWGIDFKGDFLLGNRQRCYPLTMSDLCSRYIVGIQALTSTQSKTAKEACWEFFYAEGLPECIRSDNGIPFTSVHSAWGFTDLAVWLMRLGIRLERIDAGKPQQNGRHERMHKTLKQETCRPSANTELGQQERFDKFIQVFNHERPHQHLDGATPASAHVAKLRQLPSRLPEPNYRLYDDVKHVRSDGSLTITSSHRLYLSRPLAHQPVGIRERQDGQLEVAFCYLTLGLYNPKTKTFNTMEQN